MANQKINNAKTILTDSIYHSPCCTRFSYVGGHGLRVFIHSADVVAEPDSVRGLRYQLVQIDIKIKVLVYSPFAHSDCSHLL